MSSKVTGKTFDFGFLLKYLDKSQHGLVGQLRSTHSKWKERVNSLSDSRKINFDRHKEVVDLTEKNFSKLIFPIPQVEDSEIMSTYTKNRKAVEELTKNLESTLKSLQQELQDFLKEKPLTEMTLDELIKKFPEEYSKAEEEVKGYGSNRESSI
ncbi:uncharacterized protein LOC135121024 [Zophobas morio]|uniref:uncharacterized protein LOC135121024 n=1 Tax=Zophobas morio TaxID=2755281 RepID=UPI003082843D